MVMDRLQFGALKGIKLECTLLSSEGGRKRAEQALLNSTQRLALLWSSGLFLPERHAIAPHLLLFTLNKYPLKSGIFPAKTSLEKWLHQSFPPCALLHFPGLPCECQEKPHALWQYRWDGYHLNRAQPAVATTHCRHPHVSVIVNLLTVA